MVVFFIGEEVVAVFVEAGFGFKEVEVLEALSVDDADVGVWRRHDPAIEDESVVLLIDDLDVLITAAFDIEDGGSVNVFSGDCESSRGVVHGFLRFDLSCADTVVNEEIFLVNESFFFFDHDGEGLFIFLRDRSEIEGELAGQDGFLSVAEFEFGFADGFRREDLYIETWVEVLTHDGDAELLTGLGDDIAKISDLSGTGLGWEVDRWFWSPEDEGVVAGVKRFVGVAGIDKGSIRCDDAVCFE